MSYTYKNRTDQQLTVIGVGVVEPEGTITVDREVNNPNLKLIKTEKQPVKKDGRK